MKNVRKVEIFSAGCPICEETVALVNRIACSSCEISVLDMNSPNTMKHAEVLGVKSVPAVSIDGKLAACCEDKGIDEKILMEAGIGQSLS